MRSAKLNVISKPKIAIKGFFDQKMNKIYEVAKYTLEFNLVHLIANF